MHKAWRPRDNDKYYGIFGLSVAKTIRGITLLRDGFY